MNCYSNLLNLSPVLLSETNCMQSSKTKTVMKCVVMDNYLIDTHCFILTSHLL